MSDKTSDSCGHPIEAERLEAGKTTCLACAQEDNWEAARWRARGSVDDIRWRRKGLPKPLREANQKYDED